MFEEKKTLKKMDPFPIPLQDLEENHNTEAEEKSQSPFKSQKSHKTRPNRNHQRFATPALPSINLDMGKEVLSMKGQPCDFRYTESKNSRGTSPQTGEQGCFHIKEIDKKHLMRNFPLAYFENIDLLFKIVKKKKKFVKNTYTTHPIPKNQQQNIKECHDFQSKPNDFTKQFVRSNDSKEEKGFGKQKSLNRQIDSKDKSSNKIHRKYQQVSTLSNNKNQKEEKKQFRKTLSDRKFVQINNKVVYPNEKNMEDRQNNNSLHTVLKEKSREKQIDNYIKQSIQDDFLRNLTKKNSLKQDKSPKNVPVIAKRNKFITHKKEGTQVENIKNNHQQHSNAVNTNRYQLIDLPQNRNSQQTANNNYLNDPKVDEQRSKSINRTSRNDLFVKRNLEKKQIAYKDSNSPSSITIYKGAKKQQKNDRNIKNIAVAQNQSKLTTNKKETPAQKSKINNQKSQLQNKTIKEDQKSINNGFNNNKNQPTKNLKRNFSNTKVQKPIHEANPSIHTNIINKSPIKQNPTTKQEKVNKQPLSVVSKDNSNDREHFAQLSRPSIALSGTQDLNHIPITQCEKSSNNHFQNSFYHSQQQRHSFEQRLMNNNKQQTGNINQVSSDQLTQPPYQNQQPLQNNGSIVDIKIENWHMNNIGLKPTLQEKSSQNDELSIKNIVELQQKSLNSHRQSQKENSLKITPVFQSKQNSSIKRIDKIQQPNTSQCQDNAKIVDKISRQQQKGFDEANNLLFEDEESQKIEQQFSHLKVNLHKQSSKLSPNCSNIDPQEINNFYDEILQLDVQRPTFYCPKMGRLSNLQNNHSFKPKTNSSLHQSSTIHKNNQKQFVNNVSQNNLDKQLIPYTSSKDIINSCDQNITTPALAKKKSSKVSIFSSSSQPRKICLNKFNQNSQFKKDLLNMPNEEQKHNISDFSVKQSQNHEQSSEQQLPQKSNLSQSMICIDINKKQSTTEQNHHKLFTNKISIEMVSDPQQQDRIYSISINQIDNVPRYEAYREERTSAEERLGQCSQKDIVQDGASKLDEEKCVSQISLLKMNSQEEKDIDNDLQLVIIPVQEHLNIMYRGVEKGIKVGMQQKKVLVVEENRKINQNMSEFSSSQNEIPVKICRRQSRMTQIQRKQESLKEKSMKNSRSMKQLKRVKILSTQNKENICHHDLQSKQQEGAQKNLDQQIYKQQQNAEYVEQWETLQVEEPQQPQYSSPLMKEDTIQANKLPKQVRTLYQNHRQEPIITANVNKQSITKDVSNQDFLKKQISNTEQKYQVNDLVQEKHEIIVIQQPTSSKDMTQQHIQQPIKQVKQESSTINHAQKEDPSSIERQDNMLKLEQANKLDQCNSSHDFSVIKTSRSTFKNRNQLHKMYEINIFNQLTPLKTVLNQEISNNIKSKQAEQITPKEQRIMMKNNTTDAIKQQSRKINKQAIPKQPLNDMVKQNQQLNLNEFNKSQHFTQQKDTKIKTYQCNKATQLMTIAPENQFNHIPEPEDKLEKHNQQHKSEKILVNKLSSSQQQRIIQEKLPKQNVQTNKQPFQNEKQFIHHQSFGNIAQEKQQITQNVQNNCISNTAENPCAFRKDNRQITFQKIKQLSCLVEEQFIYPDQCTKTQNVINDQPSQQPVSQKEKTLQTAEPVQQRQKQRVNTQRSTLKGSQHEMQTVRSTNMRDISTNTFDLIKKYSENSEKLIQSDDIAKISRFLSVFDRKKINNLEENNHFADFQVLWSIVMKIFIYLDSNNCYIDRIVDKKSVWLYNPFEKKPQFHRYSIIESQEITRQQRVQECLLRLLSKKQNHINDSQAIKVIIQSLTGMPVLVLKQTCYNKLDNLYRHGNIFGFTFGKGEVWRIVGTLQSKKASSQKKVRLQMLTNKEIKEISWKRFLQQFKFSFIAGFSQTFHLRSLKIDSKFTQSNPSIKLSIKQQSSDKKNHIIMGVTIRSIQSSQINGKMLVYGKTQSQKAGQQCFKYLGSGDIGLISMKLKKGQYIIVLQLDQNNHGKQIQLLLGSETGNIDIRLQKK